ncbi:MAG: energy transducer TonB [Bacteroidales bacterium]|jgi:protein TonB|nr:energy transducer TonB [Bacteroidales bacterium]
MELKKSDKANLDKRRSLFTEIGLLVALGVVFLAFEWKSAPKQIVEDDQQVQSAIEEDIIPITRQDQPPPPPPEPPKIAEVFNIVSNDIQVDNDFQIDVEADQDLSVDIVMFEESKVEEEEEEEYLFAVIEEKPLFNGKPAEEAFREWAYSITKYPPVAQENGITGRVILEFTIEKDGSVSNVTLLRGVDPSLDTEALRVIKASPKWTPGRQRGRTVKVKYQFPFNFRLN